MEAGPARAVRSSPASGARRYGRGPPRAGCPALGPARKFGERLRPDLAVGDIDDALQSDHVRWIEQQAQVSQHIPDLFAVIELAAAKDDVGQSGAHAGFLQRTRLGIGAIHHRAVGVGIVATRLEFAHLADDVARLFLFVVGLMLDQVLAALSFRPQALVRSVVSFLAVAFVVILLVIAYDTLRGIQN